jgi:hypothetical protein
MEKIQEKPWFDHLRCIRCGVLWRVEFSDLRKIEGESGDVVVFYWCDDCHATNEVDQIPVHIWKKVPMA